MSGYEVLERLRARAGHARHPGDLHHRDERAPRTSSMAWCSARSTTSPSRCARPSCWRACTRSSNSSRHAIACSATTTSLEAEVARAHAREPDHPGRHHPCAGPTGRDARQRDRQPHPAHPGVRARAGAARAAATRASPPSLDDHSIDADGQVGAAARHRQGRHPRPHPAQARQADGRRVGDHEDAMPSSAPMPSTAPWPTPTSRCEFLAYARADRPCTTTSAGTAAATPTAWPAKPSRWRRA